MRENNYSARCAGKINDAHRAGIVHYKGGKREAMHFDFWAKIMRKKALSEKIMIRKTCFRGW